MCCSKSWKCFGVGCGNVEQSVIEMWRSWSWKCGVGRGNVESGMEMRRSWAWKCGGVGRGNMMELEVKMRWSENELVWAVWRFLYMLNIITSNQSPRGIMWSAVPLPRFIQFLDGRTNGKSPHSTGLRPLSGLLPHYSPTLTQKTI